MVLQVESTTKSRLVAMPKRVASDIVSLIENEYFAGANPNQIAQRYPDIARRTVYNLCNNMRDFGAAYPVLTTVPPYRP
jgi:hypothetical protein